MVVLNTPEYCYFIFIKVGQQHV